MFEKTFYKDEGFSLIELVVVIAIMAVLMAVLVPMVLSYMENSRAQKDISEMEEIVHAAELALADQYIMDEVYSYAIPNNYINYTDSSGLYGTSISDEEFWAPDGSGKAVTITWNPDENGKYTIEKGIVNDMTFGNGSVAEGRMSENVKQCYLKEMGTAKLCQNLKQTIGNTVSPSSATYGNSSYTLFISFQLVDGINKANCYGKYNGTNLSSSSLAAIGSHTSTPNPSNMVTVSGTQQAEYTYSDLVGSGTQTSSYKQDSTFLHENDSHICQNPNDDTQCEICGCYPFVVTKWKRKVVGYNDALTDFKMIAKFTDNKKEYRVVGIADEAFKNCNFMTIKIPEGITTIGKKSFISCEVLEKVELPSTISTIGDEAFKYCTAMREINLPERLNTIGEGTFEGCRNLTEITLPIGLRTIQSRAFSQTSITEIVLPATMGEITQEQFYQCQFLQKVTIPSSMGKISKCAFDKCDNLSQITFEGTLAQWQNISKDSEWNKINGALKPIKIICIDGQIN